MKNNMYEMNIYQIYEEGKKAFNEKRYEVAKEKFELLSNAQVRFADIFCHMGYIYTFEDNYEKAIWNFKKAIEINPSYTEAIMGLAVLLQDQGDLKEAGILFNQIKSVSYRGGIADDYCLGKLSNKHAEIGDDYMNLFLYEGAIQEYEMALKLNPAYPDIRLKYAIALREYGNFEKAVFELDNILINHPKYIDAYIHLGITYYKIGFIGFALSAWSNGMEIDRNNRLLKSFIHFVESAKEIK